MMMVFILTILSLACFYKACKKWKTSFFTFPQVYVLPSRSGVGGSGRVVQVNSFFAFFIGFPVGGPFCYLLFHRKKITGLLGGAVVDKKLGNGQSCNEHMKGNWLKSE